MSLKLLNIQLYSFRLPLRRAFVRSHYSLGVRKGLLVRLQSAESVAGWGEISSLPGLHQENFDQALEQLHQLLPRLQGREFPTDGPLIQNPFFSFPSPRALFPSVRFGLDAAFINLLAASAHKPVAKLLRPDPPRQLDLIGLLHGTRTVVQRDAKNLAKAGYRYFKLKVGAQSVELDLQVIACVRAAIGPKRRLILDANRAWTWQQAVTISQELAQSGIDYIEEPLCEPERLDEFYQRTGVGYALDESLREIPARSLKRREGLRALIIKPNALGGFRAAANYFAAADRLGVPGIISSTFETGLGLTALAHWAAGLSGDNRAGLDTFRWYRNDLLEKPFGAKDGKTRHLSVLPDKIRIQKSCKIINF